MEALKVLFQRIRQLDPENAFKLITGYSLLSRDLSGFDIINLAYGSDEGIRFLISTIKENIGLPPFPFPSSTLNMNNNSVSYFDQKAPPILFPFDQSSPLSFLPSSFPIPSDGAHSIPQPTGTQNQTGGFDVGDQPPFSFFQYQFPLKKLQECGDLSPEISANSSEGDDCKTSHPLKQVAAEAEQQIDLKGKHPSEMEISKPATPNRASTHHAMQGDCDVAAQSEQVGYRVNDGKKGEQRGDDQLQLSYNPLFDSPFVYDIETRRFHLSGIDRISQKASLRSKKM